MQQNIIENFLGKIKPPVFFLLLFLYQFLFIFQGLELSDEGFFLTFYQQIFRAPETVQYNFPFWFSGIIGGAIDYLFPNAGIWGFRLAGVIVSTSTIILAYHLLKRYLNTSYLKLGLILVTLFISNNAKELQYNNISALFYLATAALLFTGIRDNKPSRLFFAGVILSLNTFTRLPNILGLGFVVGIWYHGFITGATWKMHLKRSTLFFAGFAVMTAAVLLIMKLLGHLDIYLNSLKVLFGMVNEEAGSRGKDVSTYSSGRLIKLFFTDYAKAIAYAGCVIVLLIGALIAINFIQQKSFFRKWMIAIPQYLAFLLVLALIFLNLVDYIVLLYFLTGLALIGILLILVSNNADIKILAFLGCFILLAFPLGSSEGIRMVEPYSLWLAFPIIISYLFEITSIDTRIAIASPANPFSIDLSATGKQLAQARRFVVAAVIVACLYCAYYYPFFDRHERTQMTHSVDNSRARLVFTSKGRADAMNALLSEAEKYVKPGDYLLSYDCMPMLHYLTQTKPYIRNPYPWLYAPAVFNQELADAVAGTGKLPVVIAQNIKTIGDGSDWPQTPLRIDQSWKEVNAPRDNYLEDFLNKYQYKEVWNNQVFRILVPGEAK